MQDLRPPSTRGVDMIRAAQWSLRGWPYKRSVPAGIGLRQLCSFDIVHGGNDRQFGNQGAVLESRELKLK